MSKKLLIVLLFVPWLPRFMLKRASPISRATLQLIRVVRAFSMVACNLRKATSGGGLCPRAWTANPNDSTNAYIAGFGTGTSISQQGGGSFDLHSFDMSISWYDDSPIETVTYDAFFFGGGSTSGILTLIQGLQTYNLGLTGLDHIDIGALPGAGCGTGSGFDTARRLLPIQCPGYWVMDNVDTSAKAPEPASLTLMALGLVGLLVVRKRLA